MTVAELKKLVVLEDIHEIKPDARYLITIPSSWNLEMIRSAQKALTEQGIKGVMCSDEVTFYELN